MAKKKRNYKKEYADYHGKPEQIKNRSKRNQAARKKNCPKGQEVDHKVPLSKGGSNKGKNLKCVSRKANRKKGNKTK